jgi:hypothetical protein
MEQIQRLPEQLTRNGNFYRLHKRGAKAMIYSNIGSDGKALNYEVFLIRTYPPGERFGKWYPEREVFPPSEAFGRWAWWCHNLEKALDYFGKLEAGRKPGHRGTKEVLREQERPSEVARAH